MTEDGRPSLVVLFGAAGSGKSTWAGQNFGTYEVVSSDQLRAVMGSGPADLDASVDAFLLLDQIVAGRARRRLTTVIDTLGLDPDRRNGYLQLARAHDMRAVLVVLDTEPALCRERNRERDRPVPAPVLTDQLRKVRAQFNRLESEGWDEVQLVMTARTPTAASSLSPIKNEQPTRHTRKPGPNIILQISRFPWAKDPAKWLKEIAEAANATGFDGIALMDHLIQIPQVDRAWEPIPEPWVTLGMLAGLDTKLRLGTLVSPVTFHQPGILAKTVATLDLLSNGRAFCGLGAGWWEREHAAFGLAFPGSKERLNQLQVCIETMRALWSPGTKAFTGRYVQLPETTCYPRPIGKIPIIVGGSGERRTLKIVAEQADGCNLPSDEGTLISKIGVLRQHCTAMGRDPADVEITVLDIPVVGVDRDDVLRRVERLRGRTAATTFAARHHAGQPADQRARYDRLGELGVRTVFTSFPDLVDAEDLINRGAGLVGESGRS